MLEALTPGATIVVSACSCLLCLGLFWSLQIYFLPYLRQKRSGRQSALAHNDQTMVDAELCQSLYDFPGLLYHCPRGSLTECELKSSKWSATTIGPSSLISPLHSLRNSPRHYKRQCPQRLSSTTISDVRQSLMSHTSLPMPTENSCSTITTLGHAGHAVPQHNPKYRRSLNSFSEVSNDVSRTRGRRHSAPTLSLIKQARSSSNASGNFSSEQLSPTQASFTSGCGTSTDTVE